MAVRRWWRTRRWRKVMRAYLIRRYEDINW